MVELVLWLKLGIGPFYWWYVIIMERLSWLGCYLLMSLQKVLPLLIL